MLWSAIYSSFLLLILVPESSPYLCLNRALKQGSNLLLVAHRSCWGSTVLPLVPCLVLPKWGHLESKPPWNVGDSDKRPDGDCERALLWFSFSPSLMNQQHSYQCHSDFYSLATPYPGPSASHINPVSKHARCVYRASWDMFHSVACDKPSHNTLPVLPGKRGTCNNTCLLACHQREITVSK